MAEISTDGCTRRKIKMGIKVRSGETLTGAWHLVRQRATIAGDPKRVRAGDDLRSLQSLVSLRGARSLAELIGIKMIVLPPGKFIFQGVKDVAFRGCKIAEVKFTNGMFRNLLQLEPVKLAKIFEDPHKPLKNSLSAIHPDYKHESEDCPLVGIYWFKFEAIAKLFGKRLPTELERERAAAYIDGRRFPFGNQFDESLVTFNTKGTRSVYAHRNGASPEGVLDLSGNAYEWTSTPYGNIDLSDPNNPQLPQSGDCFVLRGGSWNDLNPDNLQAASRCSIRPENRIRSVGVRFAEDF